MLLSDPPPSPADLHFRVFGVPIRVHPWFWIITVLFGLSGSGDSDPFNVLSWVVIVFVSILVHELGHAFVQRYYGGNPRITLYGLGGFAACDDCDRSPTAQILISLAGPAAGFALAALTIAAILAAGHAIEFGQFRGIFGYLIPKWQPFAAPRINEIIFDLLFVNIFWGLVNLLPIYPLDGGRVSRELFTLSHPRRGIAQSLWLSTIAAAAVAAFGMLSLGSIYMAIFFVYLAYASYQTLQSYNKSW